MMKTTFKIVSSLIGGVLMLGVHAAIWAAIIVIALAVAHLPLLYIAMAFGMAFGGKYLIFPNYPWVTHAILLLPAVAPWVFWGWVVLSRNGFFLNRFFKEKKKEPIRHSYIDAEMAREIASIGY